MSLAVFTYGIFIEIYTCTCFNMVPQRYFYHLLNIYWVSVFFRGSASGDVEQSMYSLHLWSCAGHTGRKGIRRAEYSRNMRAKMFWVWLLNMDRSEGILEIISQTWWSDMSIELEGSVRTLAEWEVSWLAKKRGRDMLSEENLGNIVGKIVSSTTSTILKYLMGSSNA